MKRCPECRKDYLDDSLLYCLDDGTALVQGTVSGAADEPATAILSGEGRPAEDVTAVLKADAPAVNGVPVAPSLPKFFSSKSLPWILAALFAIGLIGAFIYAVGDRPEIGTVPIRRVSISISTPLALGKFSPLGVGRTAIALSPDGSLLIYVGEQDGVARLMARPMDSFEDRPIPGTEGAYAPFFSFDGRSIGFFADNALKKVSLEGGQPITLCEARNAFGGAWGPEGTIIFADAEGGKLVRISATGGELTAALERDGLAATIWGFSSPEILPDGDTVIATFWESPNPDKYKIALFSLSSGRPRILVEGGMNPRYLPTGHLVYSRSSTLIAAPFDMRKGAITGPEVTLLENVRGEEWGTVQYTLASDGTLVYVSGGPAWISKPVWSDRSGAVTPLAVPPRSYKNFSLSPDGQRIAFEISEATQDLYLYEIARGSLTRFTNRGNNGYPRWTPDGTAVTFARYETDRTEIISKSVESGVEQILVSMEQGDMMSWSPDGKTLMFLQIYPETSLDLYVKAGNQPPSPWFVTPFREMQANFSRDGRYVAYVSDESGQYEIYVRPSFGGGTKWQVSTAGGEEPIWSKDGRELFYRNGQKWMAVDVTTGLQFKAGSPRMLFEGAYLNVRGVSYDVAADGRFLVLEENFKQPPTTRLNAIFNWSDEVKRRVIPGVR
mgnify:CR=1 FL=1